MKRQVFLALVVISIILPLSTVQARWENFSREDIEAFVTSVPKTAGSDMIHSCVDKETGILRIVDDPTKCLKTERRLSWSAGGQQCPAAPTGDDGSIRVYDANGQYLGIYSSSNMVFVPSVGLFVNILADLTHPRAGMIAAENKLLGSEGEVLLSGNNTIFWFCDGTYYRGNGNIIWAEIIGYNDAYHGCTYNELYPSMRRGYEGVEFDISLLPFTLPVTLPLRYE